MKMQELKGLETKELVEKVEAAVADYNQMKLNHAISPMENPSVIKAARRDIARMRTELRQSAEELALEVFHTAPVHALGGGTCSDS